MTERLVPSEALLKRHKAAMEVIHSCADSQERVMLLYFVIHGSEAIDAAIEKVDDGRPYSRYVKGPDGATLMVGSGVSSLP